MPLAVDFLQSLMCLCTDYKEIDINVIVSDSGEVDAFRGAVDNLTSCGDTFSIFPVPSNNVNGPKTNGDIINMFDILPPVFHSIVNGKITREDTSAVLRERGKYQYQTIKKLAAAATLEYDYALWLDSESIVVQPFSIRQMFDAYVAAPTVWRSRNANHDVMRNMMSGSAGVLNRTIESFGPAFWNLERQEWIIEKTVIDDLFQYVEMVHSQDFWSAWATHGAPFKITLYNMHIQSRKLETTDPMCTKYRTLESEMEMEKYGVLSASSQFVKDAMTQTGLLERSWLFLQVPGVAQKLSNMLRNYSLQLYRLDDIDIAPPEVIDRFFLDTSIHLLCSGTYASGLQ
ncbi:hypothetical protein ColKHC_13267 [Colletotrichum higginsianum]|nr:hypothetical protein ColKHC_13267 [Colletotrichum higginsianum]